MVTTPCTDAPAFMADYADFDIVCMVKNWVTDAGILPADFTLDWNMTALLLGVGFAGLLFLTMGDEGGGRTVIVR